jgi:hypothetical protein
LFERKVVVFNKHKNVYETVVIKEAADPGEVTAAIREFYKRKGALCSKGY